MGKTKKAATAPKSRVKQKRLVEADALSPLELTALAIAGKDAKKVRDELGEGLDQPIDFVVRVKGLVHVAGDAMSTNTETPKLAELLPVIFGAVGPAERAKIKDWLIGYSQKTSETKVAAAVEAEAKAVLAKLGRKVPQAKNGAVTGILEVTRVD